jgi:hypothetical protein
MAGRTYEQRKIEVISRGGARKAQKMKIVWMVQFGRAPDSGLPNVPKIQGIFGNPVS